MATDPVCGMSVSETAAVETVVHRGVTYYFCSVKCLHDFVKQPDDFVRAMTMIDPPPAAEEKKPSLALRWWNAASIAWRSLMDRIAR